MKDAKGHGSNSRGTAPGYAGRDAQGRTYTQALRDHDRFPKQNPEFPNAEHYRSDEVAANVLGQGHPKSEPVPVHPGTPGGLARGLHVDWANAPNPHSGGGFAAGSRARRNAKASAYVAKRAARPSNFKLT